MIIFCFIAVLFLSVQISAADLPIFPGLQGFGTETRGAYGAAKPPLICIVTDWGSGGSLTDETRNGVDVYTGTFEKCIDFDPSEDMFGDRGKIVLFEISGNIDVGGERIAIDYPYTSVLGATAPSPGITLEEGHLVIRTHDVFVQHLRIRPGNDGNWNSCGTTRAISMEKNNLLDADQLDEAYNIVIDQCSTSWGIDDNIALWPDPCCSIHDVTISNTISSEALAVSCHPKSMIPPDYPPHSMGMMVGPGTEKITLFRNAFISNRDRNPSLNGESAQVFNNLVYNTKARNIKIDQENPNIYYSIQGNYLKKGPESGSTADYGVWLKDSVDDIAQIYVDDTVCYKYSTDYSLASEHPNMGCVDNPNGVAALVDSEPNILDSTGMYISNAVDLMNPTHNDYILATVGARPADKDPVDERVINYAETGTGNGLGKFIDSQDEVESPEGSGDIGWPDLIKDTRNLETDMPPEIGPIPSDPHGDDDGDDYTNLEEWTHLLAFDVGSKVLCTPTECNPGDVLPNKMTRKLLSQCSTDIFNDCSDVIMIYEFCPSTILDTPVDISVNYYSFYSQCHDGTSCDNEKVKLAYYDLCSGGWVRLDTTVTPTAPNAYIAKATLVDNLHYVALLRDGCVAPPLEQSNGFDDDCDGFIDDAI